MKNIAVFASGRGSNFIKIYKNCLTGKIEGKISCIITDNKRAGIIEYAKSKAIPVHVIIPGIFQSSTDFGNEILRILKKQRISLVVLAGYLRMIPKNVVRAFSNKILNIHPALLPSFGGKGMYGMNVHNAVFESGTKITGVTVHLVNEIYDSGPIVMQRAVDIEECMSAEEIAKKVLKIEHKIYSEAIQKILNIPFKIANNRVIFEN